MAGPMVLDMILMLSAMLTTFTVKPSFFNLLIFIVNCSPQRSQNARRNTYTNHQAKNFLFVMDFQSATHNKGIGNLTRQNNFINLCALSVLCGVNPYAAFQFFRSGAK
jgi:hypothetical protein